MDPRHIKEVTESELKDYEFFKSLEVQEQSHKLLVLKKNYSNLNREGSFTTYFRNKSDKITDPSELEIYRSKLVESFDTVSPLIYLNHEQREKIKELSQFLKTNERQTLYSHLDSDVVEYQSLNCFILIECEVHIEPTSKMNNCCNHPNQYTTKNTVHRTDLKNE